MDTPPLLWPPSPPSPATTWTFTFTCVKVAAILPCSSAVPKLGTPGIILPACPGHVPLQQAYRDIRVVGVLYCRQANTYQMYLDILVELEARDSDMGEVEEYSILRDIECTH